MLRCLSWKTGVGSNAHVLLTVEDTGPGLTTIGDPDQIFDPFVTTKPGGMGLGLAISRTIVEDHGGTLRVVKTDARGTTFEIALPIRPAGAARSREGINPASG